MTLLHRKLLRDLARMKGQILVISLILGCGLTVMIMARSLVVSLEEARDAYYQDQRFGDLFVDLKRAPNPVGERLRQLPGVVAAETRVRGGALLDLPGMEEPAEASLISLPNDGLPQVNIPVLREGRWPEPGQRREILLGETFAQAHGFRPGDTIDAVIYGARERLVVVGIVLSPEFVFELAPGMSLPDPNRFAVFWMRERYLAEALDMRGGFNNVVFKTAPGTHLAALQAEIDQVLEPYGGLDAIGRADHPSAGQLEDRLEILRAFSLAFPVLFLAVAAFMGSAAVSRLVRVQREQIAQLKAFGYSSGAVGWHYLQFGLAAVLGGFLFGALGGLWLGREVVILYHEFFRFPELPFRPDYLALMLGLAASAMALSLGVLGAVRQAVRLPPAEAMRPEPPAEFRPTLVERTGLQRLFPTAFRMALRNIERKPWQAAFTCLGLMLAAAIPLLPGATRDGIAYLMTFQWQMAQRQDATVTLIEPGSPGAFLALRQLPGVLQAEPFRTVPVRLIHGHRHYQTAITGLPHDPALNRLLDADGRPVGLPPAGLLLSDKLADILDLHPGDAIRLEVREGRRPVLESHVAGTVTDFAGVGVYMEIDALRSLLGEGRTVSGAHLSIDAARRGEFLAAVKETPRLAGVSLTESARRSFDETTAEMMDVVQFVYFSFAMVVAFGVVYNAARIALSERSRELATLRVVGFSHREVSAIFVGELLLLTLLALPTGLWVGTQLAGVLIEAASTETVRIPFVLTPASYSTAALIVVSAAAFSFAVVSRRIYNLDLLSVLKARD